MPRRNRSRLSCLGSAVGAVGDVLSGHDVLSSCLRGAGTWAQATGRSTLVIGRAETAKKRF